MKMIERKPSWGEMIGVWLKIGLLSFGGPAAQISLMHQIIVDQKQWLTEQQYLNALGFCMLLPGPEAMQLATYSGWRVYGVAGGLVAGLLFVMPGAMIILGLAMLYVSLGHVPFVEAMFVGVKSAVLIIVVQTLLRLADKSLPGMASKISALTAFVAIFFFNFPFPFIILIAGIFGYLRTRKESDDSLPNTVLSRPVFKSRVFGVLAVMTVLWWAPVLVVYSMTGLEILGEIGVFFSKLAVVTFGGAYAVLAYLSQDVVQNLGWLTTGEMMDGLGLAETTPGPLILVTEFVGFIAAYREGGAMLGVVGALVTLWVTFVPCFLWIFVGAPYIEWIGNQPKLRSALSSISAAVVGVILNLSLWFGTHVLFSIVEKIEVGVFQFLLPHWQSIDLKVLMLTLLSGFLSYILKWSVQRILLIAALVSILISLI